MKKINKKNKLNSHKFTVLCSLLLESIDDMNIDSPLVKEYSANLKVLSDTSGLILERTTGITKSSTYIQEISNKVDSIIRNHYKEVI